MKKAVLTLGMLLLSLVAAACTGDSVDGTGDAPSPQQTPLGYEDRETEASPEPTVEETAPDFKNREGDISFYFETVELEPVPELMPVLQLRPKAIDSDWARTMAEAIFGENRLYEYSSQEGEPVECQWLFHNEKYYYEEDADETVYTHRFPYGKTVELVATAEMDGLPYRFNVNNREAEDFRNHSMYALLMPPMWPGTPEYTPWMVENGVYSDSEPSPEEVQAIEEKAGEMIAAMGLGDWELEARTDVVKYAYFKGEVVLPEENYTSYDIVVDCSPVYDGVAVTRHPMLSNLQSTDEEASNYYYEEMELRYTADGRLQQLVYRSPHEVLDSYETPVIALDFEDIETLLKELSPEDILWERAMKENEDYSFGEAEVFSMELGLSRTKLDDTDFLLIPTLTVKGIFTVNYETTKEIKAIYGTRKDPLDLLIIDLRDGSAIKLPNPEK